MTLSDRKRQAAVEIEKLTTGKRSVTEWCGATPDAKVPARVRARIFEREGGRCHLSGRKIMAGEAWDLDHKVALCNGGEHREANLFPALRDKHRAKTADDVAEKAKVARVRAKHLGIHQPKTRGITAWRAFDGTIRRKEA